MKKEKQTGTAPKRGNARSANLTGNFTEVIFPVWRKK